jgi:hypothetical protein
VEYYTVSRGFIAPADLEVFNQIAEVLRKMPDLMFDPQETGWDSCKNQFTCHLVCRALANCFDVSVCDGYFTRGYQHSWLTTKSGLSIIDAYPVAGGIPFIVAANFPSPWSRLYIKSDKFKVMFETLEFRGRLEIMKQVVSEIARNLEY